MDVAVLSLLSSLLLGVHASYTLRVSNVATSMSVGWAVSDITVEPPNIIVHKTASSEKTDAPFSAAFDGNLETFWLGTMPTVLDKVQWFELELSEPITRLTITQTATSDWVVLTVVTAIYVEYNGQETVFPLEAGTTVINITSPTTDFPTTHSPSRTLRPSRRPTSTAPTSSPLQPQTPAPSAISPITLVPTPLPFPNTSSPVLHPSPSPTSQPSHQPSPPPESETPPVVSPQPSVASSTTSSPSVHPSLVPTTHQPSAPTPPVPTPIPPTTTKAPSNPTISPPSPVPSTHQPSVAPTYAPTTIAPTSQPTTAPSNWSTINDTTIAPSKLIPSATPSVRPTTGVPSPRTRRPTGQPAAPADDDDEDSTSSTVIVVGVMLSICLVALVVQWYLRRKDARRAFRGLKNKQNKDEFFLLSGRKRKGRALSAIMETSKTETSTTAMYSLDVTSTYDDIKEIR